MLIILTGPDGSGKSKMCIRDSDMYMEKNKENHRRQDEGYTHNKSYR